MDLQTLDGKRRAVCFSKDRYMIFKELDESGEQGCMIISYDTNDNDILMNDCTKTSKIPFEFNKAKDAVYSDIQSAINEFSLYTRVSIKRKITDLSVATENDVGGIMMAIETSIIHDQSGFAPLTIFGYICDVVKDEECYDICNLSLSKYKSDHILKTTETTKLKEIDDLDLNVEGREIKNGKIILVNSKSLNLRYKCPECKNEILIEKDFATCNNCDMVTVKSFCIKDDKVRCLFQSDLKEIFTLIFPLFLLQEITKQSIGKTKQSIGKKSLFLQSLMTEHVTVQYDPNDMVVKLLTNVEEQTWNSLPSFDFIVFHNFTFTSVTLVL